MVHDMKIIKQIEEKIGEKLEPLPLGKIKDWHVNGYALDKKGQVVVLNLGGRRIKDISFLRSLGGLFLLSLRNNRITDLMPMSALMNLTILVLGGNQITDLMPLRALNNLTNLDLRDNQINNLTPLRELTRLEKLYLDRNQITDLTPLRLGSHHYGVEKKGRGYYNQSMKKTKFAYRQYAALALRLWVLGIILMGLTLFFQEKLFAYPKAEENQMKKIFPVTGLAIRKAVIVSAAIDEVWEAWITEKGVITFFAPRASVELAIGGDYEMYFDPKQPKGQQGSEGCKILSFSPGEMLSFTWNAPPSMPKVRIERTWVVLYFKAIENRTQISLIHLGWQIGEEWQKALQYFDRAWEVVLGRLQYRFQKEPINWKKPFTPDKTPSK